MSTIQLHILKTHLSNGQWMHAGTQVAAEESRANELVRSGLAKIAVDVPTPDAAPAPTQRAARPPANKQAPAAQNQSALEASNAYQP